MTGAIRIRRGRPDEADALSAMARRAKASWSYPPAWLAQWEAELAFAPEYIASQIVWVAECDGRLAGVLALEPRADGWTIDRLWVDPGAQGAGVGRRLVDEARAHAAREPRGDIDVLSDPYAEAFYLRLGAVRDGEVSAPMPGAPGRTLPRLVIAV
jgi:GNAT superfamily N-acetyltransferase